MLAGLSQTFWEAPCPVCEAVWGPKVVMLGFAAVAAWIMAPNSRHRLQSPPTWVGGVGGGQIRTPLLHTRRLVEISLAVIAFPKKEQRAVGFRQ